MAELLTKEDKHEIALTIGEAEKSTSGEIRVFLEQHCDDEVMGRALDIFNSLKMHRTKHHTGVLIYIAQDDRRLAIIGDKGIHHKVPPGFWDDIKTQLLAAFIKGEYVSGIKEAVKQVGIHLQKHFPAGATNRNELSNEVITGDE